jgi:transposase-like protein
MFRDLRWPEGMPTCPRCAVVAKHTYVKCRRQWRCRDCYHPFSVTAGTVFTNHKMKLQVILEAMVIYIQAVKGISALQLARHLDIEHKTAFVLLHKLRDAIGRSEDTTPMTGEVEMDGGYFLNARRPANRFEDRPDGRLAENANPNETALVVIRQRGEVGTRQDPGTGAVRTRVVQVRDEYDRALLPQVRAAVDPAAVVITDEHAGYNPLAARHRMQRVNHGDNYRGPDGANQNQAESYFSRARRLMIGQIHHCDYKYLLAYGTEIAWREDVRRLSNTYQLLDLLRRQLRQRPSRDWVNYWQGNHPADPRMAA